MDNDVRVWVDGALVDPQAPTVRALDHGVTVGDGAFETAKIDRGVVFAAARHLRRLDCQDVRYRALDPVGSEAGRL